MARRVTKLIELGAVFALALVVLGTFGQWHFTLDLTSHFRIQATVYLLLASPLLCCLKRWQHGVFCGTIGLCLAASLWPFLQPRGGHPTDATHRLLTVNVLTHNPRPDLVLELIRGSGADIVILQETSAEWIETLERFLGADWAYRKSVPRADNFGIAIYSKLPWESCDVVSFGDAPPLPSISALFQLPNGLPLRLIATHPPPPINNRLWETRNSSLRSLARTVQGGTPARSIVAGDLNCTPWSHWFRRFASESGLVNAAHGYGLHVTWMPLPFRLCGLPIDHVLVGSEIQIAGYRVGPYVGSDHRPVLVDFQ